MIQRDPTYYVTGYSGKDPYKAPFYLNALVFDGEFGDLNTALISEFNAMLAKDEKFSRYRLTIQAGAKAQLPSRILVVNASHDNLPTSYETARIFEDLLREKGCAIPVAVVNSREELTEEIDKDPAGTLLISQCANKNVYNVALAEELEREGTVIVPGKITAPGSVFSDKDSTYRLLSDGGKDWSRVARYKTISVEDKGIDDVVDGILAAIDDLQTETGDRTFFVKPHEGGGGLGGFRITRTETGYIIPDLSKVEGGSAEIHPTFIDFDVKNKAKMRELLWIYRLFASNKKMSSNYIKAKIPIRDDNDEASLDALKDYIVSTEDKRKKKMAGMVMSCDKARDRLIDAISVFEKKFSRRYIPLVNEHIDFGLWGLRAHYRLSRRGPVLETIYHRIFQLGFTEEGLGYVGSDNISNKQTGELEIERLGPLNSIMVEAIGGKEALFDVLAKGAESLISLVELSPEEEKTRVPLRLQLDLATVSRRIGEGNADTARGLCLASRWSEFVLNAREWLEDSLTYYGWKKGNG
jgi:hypothetical protein